jgi:hypothetical protein
MPKIVPVLPAQAEIQFASDTQATLGSRLRGNDGKGCRLRKNYGKHKKFPPARERRQAQKISINQAKLS